MRLARLVRTLTIDLASNQEDSNKLITEEASQILELPGVGPVVAAAVLVAWSHPGRVRSDAALAALAGTCPIPAFSGNTVRHRLNRGGDRRLNRALTTIKIVRMRTDRATRAFVARRRRNSQLGMLSPIQFETQAALFVASESSEATPPEHRTVQFECDASQTTPTSARRLHRLW